MSSYLTTSTAGSKSPGTCHDFKCSAQPPKAIFPSIHSSKKAFQPFAYPPSSGAWLLRWW